VKAAAGDTGRDVLITLFALWAVVLWEASGLDLPLLRLFGSQAGFPWRDAWVTRAVLHDGGRWLAGPALLVLAWDAWRPWRAGPSRAERTCWLLVVVASLLLLPGLKRFSATSCPWDLAEFGGAFAYVPHWLPGVADGGPGHCFPSGHAVAAFGFFGVYFLWRPWRPAFAAFMLAVVLLAGAAFGWAQMVRGAHFASHVLWSAWACWATAVIVDLMMRSTCSQAVPLPNR
jgi:membrane-associated PAP2 superfamily phosphatase